MNALRLIALLAAALPAQKYGRPAGLTFPPNPDPHLSVTLYGSADGVARVIDHAGHEIIPGGIHCPIPGEEFRVVEPLPDLTGFSAISLRPPAQGSHVVFVDWNGNLLKDWPVPAPFAEVHHDLELLANGNLLMLCRENVTDARISPLPIRDDCLVEVSPTGAVVWSWRLRDHIDELRLHEDVLAQIARNAGDWAHANSATVIPPNIRPDPEWTPGNIVLSLRFLDRVIVISRANGIVAWMLPSRTFGQHHAQFVPNPLGGSMLLFDNGSAPAYPVSDLERAPGHSAVREFSLDTGADVWAYRGSASGMFNKRFWSDIISGAQRLPNGNTLITEGVPGRLFEVTPAGTIVWEYMVPYSGRVQGGESFNAYRAFRLFL